VKKKGEESHIKKESHPGNHFDGIMKSMDGPGWGRNLKGGGWMAEERGTVGGGGRGDRVKRAGTGPPKFVGRKDHEKKRDRFESRRSYLGGPPITKKENRTAPQKAGENSEGCGSSRRKGAVHDSTHERVFGWGYVWANRAPTGTAPKDLRKLLGFNISRRFQSYLTDKTETRRRRKKKEEKKKKPPRSGEDEINERGEERRPDSSPNGKSGGYGSSAPENT